jgi:hypothetical protein
MKKRKTIAGFYGYWCPIKKKRIFKTLWQIEK